MTDILEEFRPIFYPESIAVVGASSDATKSGARYFANLVESGFKGRLYPINTSEERILGYQVYKSLAAVPGTIDYVIFSIPADAAVRVVEECPAGKVKAIQLFTAGFRELGTEAGVRREEAILKAARAAGMRVIGPNCIGIANHSVNIPFGPSCRLGKPGRFGFVSQSGGHGVNVVSGSAPRGVDFSKVISFGNGCDLTGPDFLEYFGRDPETSIVGAYLEGIRDGRRLYRVVESIAARKPVIIWKGGRTPVGARAAASHTASLATPYAVWSSALAQAGAVNVDTIEEFVDTAVAFYDVGRLTGCRAAIISGLVDGGGGDSVSATDGCASIGIEVPQLSDTVRAQLTALIRPVGTISHNPLDVGSPGADFPAIARAVELAASDPAIDVVIIQKHVDILLSILPRDKVYEMHDLLVDIRRKTEKPVVVVSSPGGEEVERNILDGRLAEAGVPVFPSIERAAKALKNLSGYWKRRP